MEAVCQWNFRSLGWKYRPPLLASAVNQLGGSITNLEEVLDEFIDAMPPKA